MSESETPSERPTTMAPTRQQGSPTLTFRGGGWVIALAGLLVVLVLGWSLLGPLLGRHPIGDGRTVESYGYDLSSLLIEPTALVASGYPRGFLPSRDEPSHILGRDMVIFNERNRPKYVVTSDRVAGIVINGQAHAWPLSMLNVHEVVNDTVAGVPVAVTYSPLCDAVIAFDRRVGGVTRSFEVSGLLVNSNLVFCDKSAEGMAVDAHVPSLFLQLERRAIAGPLAASATTLNALPDVCITTWADWLDAHPDTTVAERDPAMIRRMKEISYARYFLGPKLESSTAPLPTDADLESTGLRLKSPLIAIELSGVWWLLAFEPFLENLQSDATTADRTVRLKLAETELLVHLPKGPAVARIERADGQPIRTVPCLYFAAYSVVIPRDRCQFVTARPE